MFTKVLNVTTTTTTTITFYNMERYSSWLRGHTANVLGGRNVARGFEPHSLLIQS